MDMDRRTFLKSAAGVAVVSGITLPKLAQAVPTEQQLIFSDGFVDLEGAIRLVKSPPGVLHRCTLMTSINGRHWRLNKHNKLRVLHDQIKWENALLEVTHAISTPSMALYDDRMKLVAEARYSGGPVHAVCGDSLKVTYFLKFDPKVRECPTEQLLKGARTAGTERCSFSLPR